MKPQTAVTALTAAHAEASSLSPLDRAELHVATARAAHALGRLYRRAAGEGGGRSGDGNVDADDEDDDFNDRGAVRIEEQAERVRAARAGETRAAGRPQGAVGIDIAAARRFVGAALGGAGADALGGRGTMLRRLDGGSAKRGREGQGKGAGGAGDTLQPSPARSAKRAKGNKRGKRKP